MENKGTILYAEDDSVVRELFSEFFGMRFPDYGLKLYEGGTFLRNKLEELIIKPNNTKLIITDNDVPDLDEGIKIIEDYSQKLKIPFILAFGGSDSMGEDVIRKGAYSYILKPFNLQEFSGLIQKALDSK